MIATINTYNSPIIICAVYRPPPSQRNGLSTPAFMTEWCQFMSELTTNKYPEFIFCENTRDDDDMLRQLRSLYTKSNKIISHV